MLYSSHDILAGIRGGVGSLPASFGSGASVRRLAVVLILFFPTLSFAAISTDTSVWSNGGTVSSVSVTYTNSGNFLEVTPLFYAASGSGNSDKVTGCTYNGVSLTGPIQKQTITSGGDDETQYVFYTATPASGAHTLACSASAASTVAFVLEAESLKGANGGLDNSNSATGTASAHVFSVSVTVNAASSWIILSGFVPGITFPVYSLRAGSGHDSAVGDSNGTVSTGSNSPSIHGTNTADNAMAFAVSVSPTAPVTVTAPGYQMIWWTHS